MKKCPPHFSQIFAILFLLWTYSAFAQAATLTSTVNRNQLSTNETLTLTINYDAQVDSSLLDLNPLSKHFDVLGVNPQSSSSMSIINGQATRQASTIWTVTLVPKQEGTLTIPAFSIKGNTSQAIAITVNNSIPLNSTDQPLQVWVSANSEAVYPSQQLIVEVELSAQSNVNNLNGPELIVNNAEVENLGQQSFQRIDNGIARQIVILKYAVFTKTPGELVIPVMTYTGVQGGQRTIMGTIRGKQVVARSEQLAIKIKEIPPPQKNSVGSWFPAEDVKISAQWSGDTSALTVGAPITRTITITAKGQRASVIPPLKQPAAPSNVKSYKDQPQLENQSGPDGIIGTRTESAAIVPSVSGQLTMPELKLNWWNVKTQQWQEATIPEQTLTVSGSATPITPNTVDQNTSSLSQVKNTQRVQISNNDIIWKAVTVFLTLISVIQLWIILKLKNRAPQTEQANQVNISETEAWTHLQKALKGGNATLIRTALLAWARQALPDAKFVSLQNLSTSADNPELGSALSKLDAYLYKGTDEFDSHQLANALNTFRTQVSKKGKHLATQASDLRPLYVKAS